eukprot:4006625-Prymnesium_polylepis.1
MQRPLAKGPLELTSYPPHPRPNTRPRIPCHSAFVTFATGCVLGPPDASQHHSPHHDIARPCPIKSATSTYEKTRATRPGALARFDCCRSSRSISCRAAQLRCRAIVRWRCARVRSCQKKRLARSSSATVVWGGTGAPIQTTGTDAADCIRSTSDAMSRLQALT